MTRYCYKPRLFLSQILAFKEVVGVACLSSLLSDWSAEAYGNRFVAKTSVGCLWVSPTSRDVLCLSAPPCNTQQLSSSIKNALSVKRTVDIMMLVLFIRGWRRLRGSPSWVLRKGASKAFSRLPQGLRG